MTHMVRTTVIGLLNPGITFEDIQGFVDAKIADKELTGFKTVTGITYTEAGQARRHIKFSKLAAAEEIDHRWNLTISNEFCRRGFGDVAWKFTEVDAEDPYGEFTTVSIPPDLFRQCLEDDGGGPNRTTGPAPIGSEDFWRWFDEQDP
jgi:hypothetical protein